MARSLFDHRIFVIYLTVYLFGSLLTLRDFPTVDKTNDDMWMMDECLSYLHKGYVGHTFSLSESFTKAQFSFNLNTFVNAEFFSFFGPSIFSLRLKSVLIGALFLIAFYGFSWSLFKNQTIALLAVILLSLTHAFIYRSHDSRPDVFAAFLFFLLFIPVYQVLMERRRTALHYAIIIFLPMLIFRHVHPNGIVFLFTAMTTCLFVDYTIFKDRRLYTGGLIAVICFILYDQGIQLMQNSQVKAVAADQFSLISRLELLPFYRSIIIDSPLDVIKSIFRLIKLFVLAPVRSIQLMNASSILAFNDFLIIAMGLVFSALKFRTLSRPVMIAGIWLLSYFIFFTMLSPSTTDYTVNFMPYFIIILVTTATAVFNNSIRRTVIGLSFLATLMLTATLVTLHDHRNIKRYHQEYELISNSLKNIIPPKSSVLGAPLYFTILKPAGEYDYKEIYKSLGIDFMHKTLLGNEPYNFDSAFAGKKFDYIIFDNYFQVQLKRAGYDPEKFVLTNMSSYIPIWTHYSHYPSSRGTFETITVYRHKLNE